MLYPFVLYGLLVSGHAVAEWLGLFSLGVLVLFPGLRGRHVLAWGVLTAIAVLAAYAVARDHRALVNYLPQILVSTYLLVVFARTLRPGSVPLITRIADAMRQDGSEAPRRYTRGVTILWVVVFALLAIEGVLLAVLTPPISMGQVSAVTYAVVALVLVVEYCYHTWRYPHPDERGFLGFLRHVVQIDYRRLLSD